MLGRVIGGVIGLDAGILELAGVLRLRQTAAAILGLLALLASAAHPPALERGEERVGALRHRGAAMMPITVSDAGRAGLALTAAASRRRAADVVAGLAVAELRGALRELTAAVQVQSGSVLGAGIWKPGREREAINGGGGEGGIERGDRER